MDSTFTKIADIINKDETIDRSPYSSLSAQTLEQVMVAVYPQEQPYLVAEPAPGTALYTGHRRHRVTQLMGNIKILRQLIAVGK